MSYLDTNGTAKCPDCGFNAEPNGNWVSRPGLDPYLRAFYCEYCKGTFFLLLKTLKQRQVYDKRLQRAVSDSRC